jgi:CRISPR system Cascade subunit CasB
VVAAQPEYRPEKADGGSMSTELPDFVALKARFDSEAFPNGARAELRRASEPSEVVLLPALYRLFPGQKPDERYQRLAFLLPYARQATNAKPLGAQLTGAKISEARVLQVARSRSPMDIVQLRRLLSHADVAVDWQSFGKTLWYWNALSKRQLVEDFYLAQFTPAKGGK